MVYEFRSRLKDNNNAVILQLLPVFAEYFPAEPFEPVPLVALSHFFTGNGGKPGSFSFLIVQVYRFEADLPAFSDDLSGFPSEPEWAAERFIPAQAANLFLPLFFLRLRIFNPDFVLILFLKPCFFFLFLFFG